MGVPRLLQHRSDVSFSFVAEDALSGVSGTVPAGSPATVTGEGTGLFATVTATDIAGNSNSVDTPAVQVDRTAPAVDISSPADGASFSVGSAVTADYACSDVLSGIESCAGPVASGASIDTSAAGSFEFTVEARDIAGNAVSRTHSYEVVSTYTFEGFNAPVDDLPIVNTIKAGRGVPVKWRLSDGNGGYLSDLATFKSLTSQPTSCVSGTPASEVEEAATTGASGLQFDSSTSEFTYVWKTASSWKNRCRILILELADGQRQFASFQFR